MTWPEFKAAAYPPHCANAELDKSSLWRAVRWLAIRCAYLFSCSHLSANGVSLLGAVCGVVAVAQIACSQALPAWTSILPIVSCYATIFLDFCDGPVARARGTSGRLGRVLDGIGTDFLREGLLIALGAAARSPLFLLAAIVAGHLLVSVRNQFIWQDLAFDAMPNCGILGRLIRPAFSVLVMLGALPILIAAASFGGFMITFSRVIVIIYAALSCFWFWRSCAWAGRSRT